MKLRPRRVLLVLAAGLLPVVAAWADPDSNLLANGEFEPVRNGRPAEWRVKTRSAKVACEQVGGRWYHNAFTFNTGKYERIRVGFYMAPGANGSVWIDNLRSEPALAIVNPSFEKVDKNGALAGWAMTDPGTLFSDTARVSHGKRSFRITYKAAEPQSSRIKQFVQAKPNTDYRISFDLYIGDGFLGALRPNIYAGVPGTPHITGPDWSADDIVNERGRFGRRVGVELKGGTAEISQEVTVAADRSLEVSVAVKTKGLDGKLTLAAVDGGSSNVLGKTTITKADADWQTHRVRFRSASDRVVVRLAGAGKGDLKLANARLGDPWLIPPVQEIEWLPASERFAIG